MLDLLNPNPSLLILSYDSCLLRKPVPSAMLRDHGALKLRTLTILFASVFSLCRQRRGKAAIFFRPTKWTGKMLKILDEEKLGCLTRPIANADRVRQGEGQGLLGGLTGLWSVLWGPGKDCLKGDISTATWRVSGSSEIACGKTRRSKGKKSSYRNWHLHCLRSRAGVAENVSACANKDEHKAWVKMWTGPISG